jgi:hypothetical protein
MASQSHRICIAVSFFFENFTQVELLVQKHIIPRDYRYFVSIGNMGMTKITSDERTVLRKIFCPRLDKKVLTIAITEE